MSNKNHLSTTSSVYSQDSVHYKGNDDDIQEESEIEEVSNPSFTSINNSLLKNRSESSFGIQSVESFDSKSNHNSFDDDKTPKLPTSSNYKDDSTPIIPTTGFNQSPLLSPNLTPDLNHLLPQKNLNNKFKRLSVTLQSSSLATSDDSYKFMNKFNNNVRSSHIETNNRVSTYYQKINNPINGDDDDVTPEMVGETSINKLDNESIASSVSNRSSFSDGHSREESEGSFTFQSNYNGMNKVHPLKVIKNKSIPIDIDSVASSAPEAVSKETAPSATTQPIDPIGTTSIDNVTNEIKGLDISYNVNEPLSKREDLNKLNVDNDEDDLSSLFVRALHPFDSSTLQSEADASICLPFEKDDLAVVHTIDESGWGEVTLIETLQRGWVPMNYFKFAIDSTEENDDFDDDEDETDEADDGKIPNSKFLKSLFHSCGKFLVNPLSHKNRKGKFTFSIRVVNMIRDGVRVLLQETDCLSRSNEIVTKRPIVRKARKTLLADWYNLMIKANDFKGTSNYNKIEILTLMIYQVIRRAIEFLKLWSIESKQIIKKENERKLQNDMNTYPLLETPPLAKQRVTEINGILYSYLGLIIGRLDLIEHNSIGCDLLETLTHHIILLLRELLFISKTGSEFSSEKPADLDNSLDNLLSLVSDLVTAVKSLVVSTLNETVEEQSSHAKETPPKDLNYYYTPEGGELIQISSKMIKAISTTVSSIRKLLEITGNFKLNVQRSYPDYSKMRVEPASFIRQCSIGIANANTIKNRQLKNLQTNKTAASNRYSMMRSGKTGDLSLTPSGAGLLHDVLLNDIDESFSKDKDFAKFNTTELPTQDDFKTENELLVDSKGNLLGASFKGLVYTLTNESSPPEYFFVSTFFICFRSFANGNDLLEELISRFDISNQKNEINTELRLKNRRRLIAKMFQLWLESYWDLELDIHLLPTLINFFNEGISQLLPLDSMKLLEVAAKLSSKPLTETAPVKRPGHKQLITRSITVSRMTKKDLPDLNGLNSRYSMVDGYELSKINTNSSASNSIKSMSLPLPLGVGNQTSSSSSLLTKNNISTIEKLNLTYRAIIGNGWCANNYINDKHYIPIEVSSVLANWYTICDQSWVLSNYRPNLLDFNGLELAKQLTLIESTIFCKIKAGELLNENYATKKAHLNLAPNVRQCLLFTNCLSAYVIESVLQPKITNKLRLNIIKTWLKVAISCLYLRNFNSLAAIITSLQSHLITRLGKLWEELSEKYLELYEYLSGIIHPDKNYTVYRSKLRNFLISNEYNIPTVPYFHLFLQDLTFITEGNSNYRKANDFLNKKLINIDKYLKITRIIADIESLQISYQPRDTDDANDYSIIPVPSLQELVLLELWKISQLNKKEEDRAWKLSCLIQPRDAN